MISRQEVIALYQMVLDREPESDQVINEKRGTFRTAGSVGSEMLMSDEFIQNNVDVLHRLLG